MLQPMSDREWQEFLAREQFVKSSIVDNEKNTEKMLKEYSNDIDTALAKLISQWMGFPVNNQEKIWSVNPQNTTKRFAQFYHYGQWRLILWFGTNKFPQSLPDLHDNDTEDFFNADVHKQVTTVYVNISYNAKEEYYVSISDRYQNILYSYESIKKVDSFTVFIDYLNNLRIIAK